MVDQKPVSGEGAGHFGGVAFALALASFAAYQQFKLPVVLPVLLERYDYDRTLAGGFMSVYALVGLFVSLKIGSLISRFGAGPPILISLGLFVVACLMALLAPQLGLLMLFARALEGLAFAVVAIAGPALANQHAGQKNLPLVVGLIATWIPVGQLTATLLAPAALVWADWELLWLVGVGLSLVFALWTWRMHREGLLGQGEAKAVAEKTRFKSDRVEASSGFSWRQWLGFVLTGSLFMLWSSQYFAYMTWLPQYLVEVHDLGVEAALWGYVVPVFLVLVACVFTGLLLRSGCSIVTLLVVALITQVGVWVLLPYTDSGWSGLISLVVYGVGAGFVPATLFGFPSALLRGGSDTTRAYAVVMTGRNIGVFVGPILLAQAFVWSGSWDLAAPIFGSITAACLPVALFLGYLLRLEARSHASARAPSDNRRAQ